MGLTFTIVSLLLFWAWFDLRASRYRLPAGAGDEPVVERATGSERWLVSLPAPAGMRFRCEGRTGIARLLATLGIAASVGDRLFDRHVVLATDDVAMRRVFAETPPLRRAVRRLLGHQPGGLHCTALWLESGQLCARFVLRRSSPNEGLWSTAVMPVLKNVADALPPARTPTPTQRGQIARSRATRTFCSALLACGALQAIRVGLLTPDTFVYDRGQLAAWSAGAAALLVVALLLAAMLLLRPGARSAAILSIATAGIAGSALTAVPLVRDVNISLDFSRAEIAVQMARPLARGGSRRARRVRGTYWHDTGPILGPTRSGMHWLDLHPGALGLSWRTRPRTMTEAMSEPDLIRAEREIRRKMQAEPEGAGQEEGRTRG